VISHKKGNRNLTLQNTSQETKKLEQALSQKNDELKAAELKLNGTKILLSRVRDELELIK